jgi:hypothetical protein
MSEHGHNIQRSVAACHDMCSVAPRNDHRPGYRTGTSPGFSPLTIGTRTALPHSVHEPS